MTAFDTAWNIMKMSTGQVKYFSEEEKREIAEMNRMIANMNEPLDPDPSVNFPSECSDCFYPINNILEGIPSKCSRCLHPHVNQRILDAQEIAGMFGDGKPFNLQDVLRQNETLVDPFDGIASRVDFRAYEDRMRDFE